MTSWYVQEYCLDLYNGTWTENLLISWNLTVVKYDNYNRGLDRPN